VGSGWVGSISRVTVQPLLSSARLSHSRVLCDLFIAQYMHTKLTDSAWYIPTRLAVAQSQLLRTRGCGLLRVPAAGPSSTVPVFHKTHCRLGMLIHCSPFCARREGGCCASPLSSPSSSPRWPPLRCPRLYWAYPQWFLLSLCASHIPLICQEHTCSCPALSSHQHRRASPDPIHRSPWRTSH
jgi:hypothetical protein